jgi:hypothetical protein
VAARSQLLAIISSTCCRSFEIEVNRSAYSAKCNSAGAGVSHESRNRIRQRKLIHRQLRRIEISKGGRR